MPQATKTYILNTIVQNIPPELLDLAFRPRLFNTTVEQRIVSEIIEGPILLDTNLIGGKRRDILIHPAWEMNINPAMSFNILGAGLQGSFYKIPPEAREGRNISSVIGVTGTLAGSMTGSINSVNGAAIYGNNATGMIGQLLGSRTMNNYNSQPMASLEGTNIIRFSPRQMIEGHGVTVMLEFDSEFLNVNQSAIYALQNLCLCATKRYIANRLRVPVDESEIVAGMEVGVIKELVLKYEEEGGSYHDLLIKFKGASHYSERTISQIIRHGI